MVKYSFLRIVRQTLAVTEFEMRKLRHEPSELLVRTLQPIIWLLIFGEVLANRLVAISHINYMDFITPGILAQSILFVAIFHGLNVIWERDLGVIYKLLVAPVPRIALVMGKALTAGIRSLSQVFVIYLLSALVKIHLNYSLSTLVGVIVFTLIGAGIFSTFSLIIASIVKTRERFMGVGQVLTMPLFFASNAIYPITLMPIWLKIVSHFNPLTYEVDALRGLMLNKEQCVYGIGVDLGVLCALFLLLLIIGSKLYPHLGR